MGGNCLPALSTLQQLLDESHPSPNTLRREREPGVGPIDVEIVGECDRTRVECRCHAMESDPMATGALVQRPAGRMQTRSFGERTRVKVVSAQCWRGQHAGIDDLQ